LSSVYLAFDLGAESGRAVVGRFDAGRLSIQEMHRFPNEPVRAGGSVHWDVLRLWHEIRRGLQLAAAEFPALTGVGVDTWGVDYALLDRRGDLLGNPYHYRDSRTDGIPERVFKFVSAKEIYSATGIQFMQINTLFQVFAAMQTSPGLLNMAHHFVTMPDLLNYWLTGRITCEFTNATTTQMFDTRRGTWALSMLERLGIPTHFLKEVTQPGSRIGSLREDLKKEFGIRGAEVIAPACHDTGSAVAAISSRGRSVFLSSGTWSLMGAEVLAPVINETARTLNFTNEGGVGGTIRLLKNITGMWLLQCCRKCWQEEGRSHDYASLVALATAEPSLNSFIDPNDPSFLHPASMTDAIRGFCQRTGQAAPSEPAEFVQIIFESLALMYRSVVESLETLTGQMFEEIRVVGGGARNRLLNQFTADATGLRVIAGPVEATALGNIAMQMVATGAVGSIGEARSVIDASFPTEVFDPSGDARWQAAYERFRSLLPRTTRTSAHQSD
jgi:rhamnulokinase